MCCMLGIKESAGDGRECVWKGKEGVDAEEYSFSRIKEVQNKKRPTKHSYKRRNTKDRQTKLVSTASWYFPLEKEKFKSQEEEENNKKRRVLHF